MADLVLDSLSASLGGRRVLDRVSLTLRPGELVALIGPNGAGKTTLLRAALGLQPITAGRVLLAGRDPGKLPAAERARLAAYLPQARALAWPLAVRDLVALGRFAHGARLGRLGPADAAAVARALAAAGLEALAERSSAELSGGELARAHVARALAAETPLIFADEPTAALDPLHAFQVLAALKRFAAAGGGALATLHDLSLAARFADRLALLAEGRLLAEGPPAAVLTRENLARAFGVAGELREGFGVCVSGPAAIV